MCESCNRCELHCACLTTIEPSRQTQKREGHSRTVEKIAAASIEIYEDLDEGDVEAIEVVNLSDDLDADEQTHVVTCNEQAHIVAGDGNYTAISNFQELTGVFGIPYNRRKNMLAESKRSRDDVAALLRADKYGERKVSDIVNVMMDVMEHTASIILPGDPGFLLEEACERMAEKHAWGTSSDRKAERAVTASVFSLMRAAPPHTMAYRTTRAIVASSVPASCIETSLSDFNPPHLGRRAIKSGKADRATIEKGSDPLKCVRSLARLDIDVIHVCLSQMLSPSNVGAISWGEVERKVPGTTQTVTLPGLTRRKSVAQMHREYVGMIVQQALESVERVTRNVADQAAKGKIVKMVCKSLYFKIAKAVTSHAEKRSNAVDYCDDVLINESVHTLRRIVKDLVAPEKKAMLIHLIEVLQNFLKHQYNAHVLREDDEVSGDSSTDNTNVNLYLSNIHLVPLSGLHSWCRIRIDATAAPG